MERLSFTTKVLGSLAAYQLMNHKVTQTLRSKSDPVTAAAEQGFLKIGDDVEIALDGKVIGRATYQATTVTHLTALDKQDAIKGGFDTLEALHGALKRAGFRFLPEYQLYRTQFKWKETKSV